MTITAADLDQEAVDRFFWYARERHAIWHRRRAGLPRPWTTNPVMSQYRITNVFRELDKTTAHLRRHVRDPLRSAPEVLLAVVIYRWFNTIRSGETLFQQSDLLDGATPFEAYLRTGEPDVLRAPLRRQGPPWVTGAYMIRSPEGMDKLDGIVHCVDLFAKKTSGAPLSQGKPDWRVVAEDALALRDDDPMSLRRVWAWLLGYYGLGKFLAYEIVTDLRHTALLDRAPDIMTWANPGPGALRGANLILRGAQVGRKGRLQKASYDETDSVMSLLLELSRDPRYWPQQVHDEIQIDGSYNDQLMGLGAPQHWPSWELREPEMWLCEFAKLERTRLGLGRPRGTYT